jgi:hypothetical protein
LNNVLDHSNLDSIITLIFLKKLCTPIVKTSAYAMELINQSGKVIKRPSTDEERIALTILDEVVFFIKRAIGGKISQLNSFLYTLNLGQQFYNKLQAIGSVETRSEIIRIKRDVQRLSESYNITKEEMFKLLIAEEVESQIEGK